MPFKKNVGKQIADLAIKMENKSKTARRAGNRRMQEGTKVIADLARTYAPEDEGNLGEAIKARKTKSDNDRRVNSYEVFIDEDAVGSNGAQTVGKYAVRMHEDLSYQLGSKSLAKDSDVGGNGLGWPRGGKVGPMFLTRAMNDFSNKIDKQIREAIKRGLR